MTARTGLLAAVLLVVPLAVYWPTIFHEYGFRDDYAHLRETRETPETLLRHTSSYARPLYGALLVATVRPLGGSVKNLQWLRLASVLLLGLVGVALWQVLARSGWPLLDAAAVGLLVTLLPAAQVTIGWSIAWPIALALLLALAGYRGTDAALAARGARRAVWWLLAGAAYAAGALIYQPSVLFFAVPLGAALLLRDDRAPPRAAWTGAHIATALAGLVAAHGAMQLVFALELAPQSGVIALERDPLGKLVWFLSGPLANSLALFALRDRFATSIGFWIAALAVAALIASGLLLRRNRTAVDRYTVLFCVLVLPFVACAVNLAAGVRVPGYRTTYGLAGFVVVLVVYSLRQLRTSGRLRRAAHYAALAAIGLAGALLANRHAYGLIALPQGYEWGIVRDAARSLDLGAATRVYIIRPTLEDRATRRVFADEFGSLSSSSDWATAEMFKSALRLRFPHGLPAGVSYTLASGLELPRRGSFDAVIDMRRLEEHRLD
jgi:hypothetical protein